MICAASHKQLITTIGGIFIALFTVWVFYIYSSERGSTAHSIVNRIRKTRSPSDDIESLPLRQWPAPPSTSAPPSSSTSKWEPVQHVLDLAKPKLAKTNNRPVHHKTPIRRMCSKIERNMAWQHGTLRGKSRLQSSLSILPEKPCERRALKIGPPIVHPRVLERMIQTHNLSNHNERKEAKRTSEAAFRFAAQYKPSGTPTSPGYNGGPSRRSITSPIVFSPTMIKSPGAQSRSSIITWFRLHPGEKVL